MARNRKKTSVRRKNSAYCRQQHTPAAVQPIRATFLAGFLCLAIIAFGFAFSAASNSAHGQGTGSATTGATKPPMSKAQAIANAWCGVKNKPACPPPPNPWVQIKSEAPADIIAAAKSTSMYQSALTTNDLIGQALRSGTIATPVLVRPYRNDVGLPEVWVIPVVNSTGIPTTMLEFNYDPAKHRIYASEFDAVNGNMFYATRRFPAVTAAQALGAVQREQHTMLALGGAPELIYFPSDHQAFITGTNNWAFGGTAVIDPIWRVPGANGHWYYVDHTGHTHLGSVLPIAAGLPPAS